MANPLTIAVWFMDDGGIAYRPDGCQQGYLLNTQSFTLKENEIIADIFEKTHGVHATVQRNHEYHRIGIYQKTSRDRFRNLIEKLVIPSMQYKLG